MPLEGVRSVPMVHIPYVDGSVRTPRTDEGARWVKIGAKDREAVALPDARTDTRAGPRARVP